MKSKKKEKIARRRNVFLDLGFSPRKARQLQERARVHHFTVMALEGLYSVRELQKILKEPRERIIDFLTGKTAKFTLKDLDRYFDLIETYEQEHYPIPEATPAEVRAELKAQNN